VQHRHFHNTRRTLPFVCLSFRFWRRAEHCRDVWGVEPAFDWITTRYGLPRFSGASNIVFTNGLYDPWSGASLQESPAPERDLVVVNISEGAHHLDLFFTNPHDPASVTDARKTQMAFVKRWIQMARSEASTP
jgi:lysosomal Pro-X carboxypeptidase